MSIIDQLIQIKKQSDSGDIVKMLDEFVEYSKFSKVPALSDVTKSPVLQKKLPLMTEALTGNVYYLSVYLTALDIVTHLGFDTPIAVREYIDNLKPRIRQRLVYAQTNTLKVTFHGLDTYFHDQYKDDIQAVYTKENDGTTQIVILVQHEGRYFIFQGSYQANSDSTTSREPVSAKEFFYSYEDIELKIRNYSIQGNNSYFFATVTRDNQLLNLMMPKSNQISLSSVNRVASVEEGVNTVTHKLTIAETNYINMNIATIETFAAALAETLIKYI